MSYLTWLVMIGTALLGGTAGVLGSFAVLRRRALVGDVVAHAALPGLCLAFLVIGARHFVGMLAGAFLAGLAGIALMTIVCRWTRTKEDAALGLVLSAFFGAGIMLSSYIQNIEGGGSRAGLETYIYGQAAGMLREDLFLISAVSAVVLAILAVFYKEFKLLSFDPGFAQAQGWPTLALDLTLMGSLTLVTVMGLPVVGVVLMAAMLILPGAAARFWTDRLERMLLLSAVLGAAAGTIGSLISAGVVRSWLGFDPFGFAEGQTAPTGPVIVLCGTGVFLFSMLVAPNRGLLARLWRWWRLRTKTGDENLLRTLYEFVEGRGADAPPVTAIEVAAARSWSPRQSGRRLRRAVSKGWVRRVAGGIELTPAGRIEAERLVRAHRLWELFLIHGASIAPDHVDRDADTMEHVLAPEILAELERRFGAAATSEVPQSPHAIESANQ